MIKENEIMRLRTVTFFLRDANKVILYQLVIYVKMVVTLNVTPLGDKVFVTLATVHAETV